jgi:lambda family phage portal protein
MNALERMILVLAPRWGLSRARARAAVKILTRHYESAAVGRRTANWSRTTTDANTAASGALSYLRFQARDLIRNNPWARRGQRRIVVDTVGWGIRPKPATGAVAAAAGELWKRWGETTECDADGRLTFYGLQRQVMATVVEAGEILVRRRFRRPSDGLSIPVQLQLLEPDYLDATKDGITGQQGGPIIQGVEFDAIGRRTAYWLFADHPGSSRFTAATSSRYPAEDILHVFPQERPGQVRGPSWFAPVDVRLHELDEYEDATLMKQKIAACFAAFVTDVDGAGTALGEAGTDSASDQVTDTLEPGLISNLPPGKTVTFGNPPVASDHESFTATALRAAAAGLGVTYEDMTGDYSQVNFSSARMARLAHYGDVHDWRWNMLVPLFCAPAWSWMLEAAALAGLIPEADIQPAEWTAPPMPMIDPDKEGLALSRLVRAGAKTHDEMVREQGYDPDSFWDEYEAGLKNLDERGIILDSDARRTTAAGLAQGAGQKPAGNGVANGKTPPDGSAQADEPAAGQDA